MATKSAPNAASPMEELGAEEPRGETDLPEGGVPTAARAEEEDGVTAFSFWSILADNGKWAERLMAQVCTPELKRSLRVKGPPSATPSWLIFG